MTVACNPFVYRQTADSRFSHYVPASGNPEDTWAELVELVERYRLDPARVTSLKPGKVVRVSLPVSECPGRFFSAVIAVDENTQLEAFFAKRPGALEGELPFIHTFAVGGEKASAMVADVILYHESHLNDEEKTYTPEGATEPVRITAQWQIVSINCRTTEEEEPPTPVAMARNFLAGLEAAEGAGGSAADYTAEQFARAIMYWSRRTMRR
jgi:hypothetical protein